ncbi:uncharacterized protein [Apostichopus japonicus]|uniref:uncharacterized protein n=1 Tax=Stichopus japonicus TaxID=307972 RepID=UPI003AB2F5A7
MKFRVIWLEPEQDKGAESVLPRSSIIDEGNIVVGQEVTCKWRKMRYRAVIDSIIDKKRTSTWDVLSDVRETLFQDHVVPLPNVAGNHRENIECECPELARQMEKLVEDNEKMAKTISETKDKVDAIYTMMEGLMELITRRAKATPTTPPPPATPLRCLTNTQFATLTTSKKRANSKARPSDNGVVLIGGQFELLFPKYVRFYEQAKDGGDFVVRLFEHFFPGDELKNYNYFGNVDGKRGLVETREFDAIIRQAELEFPGFRSTSDGERSVRNKLNNKCRKVAFLAAKKTTLHL